LCCKQGQSRECPSGSKRVLHRPQLRTNYPAVGKQTDGFDAPRVAHPYTIGIRLPRPRFPSSFDLSNALCNNPAWQKLLRGSPCLLWTANPQASDASPQTSPKNTPGELNLAERDGKFELVQVHLAIAVIWMSGNGLTWQLHQHSCIGRLGADPSYGFDKLAIVEVRPAHRRIYVLGV
jgi:hypothetical protein